MLPQAGHYTDDLTPPHLDDIALHRVQEDLFMDDVTKCLTVVNGQVIFDVKVLSSIISLHTSLFSDMIDVSSAASAITLKLEQYAQYICESHNLDCSALGNFIPLWRTTVSNILLGLSQDQ